MAVETWSPASLSWSNGFAASDLNSLANGSMITSSLSAPQIDNTTGNPYTRVVFSFVAGASMTASANGHILVGLVPLMPDGTNYASGSDGATTSNHYPWFQYPNIGIGLRSVASTERQIGGWVQILPMKYKVFVVNRSGVALPSSGNMVQYALFRSAIV